MAMKGGYEYVYMHGYQECLYNLQEDPQEPFKVIDDERYSSIHWEMKSALLEQLDPGEIAVEALQRKKNLELQK